MTNSKQCLSIMISILLTASLIFAQSEFFDDFTYSTSADSSFHDWYWVRSGIGAPGQGTWDPDLIVFYSDPQDSNNIIMKIPSQLSGEKQTIKKSSIETHEYMFREGTFSARVYFTDSPSDWNDLTVQAFFTINTLETYAEVDMEYLAWDNNYWYGEGLYMTSWGDYKDGLPMSQQDRELMPSSPSDKRPTDLQGWHILMMIVNGGHIKYYLDGDLMADHSGSRYPDCDMRICFSHWPDVLYSSSTTTRKHDMEVDWVYHQANIELSTSEVEDRVKSLRTDEIHRINTVLHDNKVIDKNKTLSY